MITDALNYVDTIMMNYVQPVVLMIFFFIIIFKFSDTLSIIIRLFICLAALLLTLGGTFALLMGLLKLSSDVNGFIDILNSDISSIMDIEAENLEKVFINLIHLAEYLLVGITFFSIAKRLLMEPYFKIETEVEQPHKMASIPDLEIHIIGMVIATISVAFIGFVVSNDSAEITLKFGVGIAAFVASLGLYLKLSYSHKNEATLDDLQLRITQLHTTEHESLQEITKLKSDIKEINSKIEKNH